MNTKQLRKLIDETFLKVGDKAACETLMESRNMDLNEMNSGCKRDHIAYLVREVGRKSQDIIDIVRSS